MVGLEKFTLLNRLNNSPRSSRRFSSRMGKFLNAPLSNWKKPGPVKILRPAAVELSERVRRTACQLHPPALERLDLAPRYTTPAGTATSTCIAARQKAGRSSGLREVTRLPSTTTSSST